MIRLARSAGRVGSDGSDQQLEADVMRFVAIIALCIVAISTLVEDALPPAPVFPDKPEPVPVATASRIPSPPMVAAPPTSPPESASARAGGVVAITSEHDAVPKAVSPSAPPRPMAGEPWTAPDAPLGGTADDGGPRDAAVALDDGVAAQVEFEAAERTPADRSSDSSVAPATARSGIDPSASESAALAELPVAEPAAVESGAVEQGAASPADTDSAPPAEPPTDEPGFTLRFASDAALLRLVGRGEAGLYVFDDGATLRLDYGPNGAAFAPATGPGQYHEIAAATVPDLLRRTLARRDRRATDVVWGVTLPSSTRAALARLISDHRSGELVIDERGRVRLETPHDRS